MAEGEQRSSVMGNDEAREAGHTPTTDEIRRDYAAMRDEHMYSPSIAKARAFRESGGGEGEFDRWLAAHDTEKDARIAELESDHTESEKALIDTVNRLMDERETT